MLRWRSADKFSGGKRGLAHPMVLFSMKYGARSLGRRQRRMVGEV